MTDEVFLLPPFFDYGATFFWAVSGALLAARRGYDVIGMLIIALISSTGGGLLRDGLFLQDGPPLLVRSPVYLGLVVTATVFVMVTGHRVHQMRFEQLISVVDAAGLGAYAVVGMNRADALGLTALGIVLVGMVNAVGGSLLRSMVIAREPHLLRPGTLEAAAALIGCIVFLAFKRLTDLDQTIAAWVTIAIVFLIRMLSVRYHIQTRAMAEFEKDWTTPP